MSPMPEPDWIDLETACQHLSNQTGEAWAIPHILKAIEQQNIPAFAVAPYGSWDKVSRVVGKEGGRDIHELCNLAGDRRFALDYSHAHDLISGDAAQVTRFRVGEYEFWAHKPFLISREGVLLRKEDLVKYVSKFGSDSVWPVLYRPKTRSRLESW